MRPLLCLLSIPFFILIFLGGSLYLQNLGVEQAFYKISPTVAILPAIIWALLVGKGAFMKKIDQLIEGMTDKTLLSMCIIFILAGAFGVVTQAIGCIDDLVNLILSILPQHALLPGLFILSALIGFGMGSSMGVVAAVTPIALGLATETSLSLPLCLGIVIGGAMFGDNLSYISDTTIAATQTQNASVAEKFKLNAPIALLAALLYIGGIFYLQPEVTLEWGHSYHLIKLIPYLTVVLLALVGLNVFSVLGIGILVAGGVGILDQSDYTLLSFTEDIYKGFSSMHEIMVLSLLVGGLSGLIKSQGGFDRILSWAEYRISKSKHSPVYVEISIVAMVSIVTAAVANNVISVFLVGTIGKSLAEKYKVMPAKIATWLSIFSCCVQGILPYGAQILLASRLAGTSPFEVVPYVGYCLVLSLVGLTFLLFESRYRVVQSPRQKT